MKKFILGIFLGVAIAVVSVLYVQQEQANTQAEVKTETNAINKFRKNRTQTPEELNRQMQNKIAIAANDFMQAKTPQDMLNAINEIIKLRPQDPNLYLLKSQILKNQGNLKGALEEINKAISLEPQNPNLYQVRGEIEFGSKNFEKAERDFTIAAQLSGKADNYYNRAITNLNLGNYKAANLDFKKAQELYRKEGNLFASKQSKDISNLLTKNMPKPQAMPKTPKTNNKNTQEIQQNNAAVNDLIKSQMPKSLKRYSESETLKDFQDLFKEVNTIQKTNIADKTNLAPEPERIYQNVAEPEVKHNLQSNSISQNNPSPRTNYAPQNNTVPQNNLEQSRPKPQNISPREDAPTEYEEPQSNVLPEEEQQRRNQNDLTLQQNVAMPKITRNEILKSTPLISIHEAENLMAKKDYEGAQAVLDNAIHKFPQADNLYYSRAQSKYLQGNYKGALNDLDKALELNPQNTKAAITKGDLYSSLGQNSEAKNAYQEAAQIAADSGNKQALNEAQTKYQLAAGQEITAKADERFQKAANAYTNKDYSTAVALFNQIYEENPTPENAFNLGLAYKGQGNSREAYRMLSFTADNKPENFEAQMIAAQTAADQPLEDYENARRYLDKAKAISKETGVLNPDMWALSAQINSALGDHDSARQDLENALDGYNEEMRKVTDPEERQRIEAQVKQINEYLQQFENN